MLRENFSEKSDESSASLTSRAADSASVADGDGVSAAALTKESHLRRLFREMQTALVAFSGGVDSSYLAVIARQELGENALAVIGVSPSLAETDRRAALDLAAQFGVRCETLRTDELDDARYQANNPNRCYFCKSELYDKLAAFARERGFQTVVDGSTVDDLADYRPGRQATAERGVRSPLIEADLTKTDVRRLSRRLGLPTWDKPASPCLASRIAYGIPVSIARLSKVERGERILRELGFVEFRVRFHEELVRLEIAPEEMERALQKETVDILAARFRELGFRYVTLDLHGYRRGAMNEILKERDEG